MRTARDYPRQLGRPLSDAAGGHEFDAGEQAGTPVQRLLEALAALSAERMMKDAKRRASKGRDAREDDWLLEGRLVGGQVVEIHR